MNIESPRAAAAAIERLLESEADPVVRDELSSRYGIHVEHAHGIPMRRLKAIAKDHAPDHELAARLWTVGVYEARVLAVLVDDAASVTSAQMQRWADDFDNWAIVDTACFHLFDRAPPAWAMVEPWALDERLFLKRAGFALVWALALHDHAAPDSQFRAALGLIDTNSTDDRPLVSKALTMAMRAIATKRPSLRAEVIELARHLDTGPATARRVGRPILKAFGTND